MSVYQDRNLVHFFSYETKVSFELPIAWEQEEESALTATYEYQGDADEYPPKLIFTGFTIPEGHPEAYQRLAQETVEQPKSEQKIIFHGTEVIDDYLAVVDVFSYSLDKGKHRVAQYQVFVQLPTSNIIYSITGMVAENVLQEFLPVFTSAVQSIRFIPV